MKKCYIISIPSAPMVSVYSGLILDVSSEIKKEPAIRISLLSFIRFLRINTQVKVTIKSWSKFNSGTIFIITLTTDPSLHPSPNNHVYINFNPSSSPTTKNGIPIRKQHTPQPFYATRSCRACSHTKASHEKSECSPSPRWKLWKT